MSEKIREILEKIFAQTSYEGMGGTGTKEHGHIVIHNSEQIDQAEAEIEAVLSKHRMRKGGSYGNNHPRVP